MGTGAARSARRRDRRLDPANPPRPWCGVQVALAGQRASGELDWAVGISANGQWFLQVRDAVTPLTGSDASNNWHLTQLVRDPGTSTVTVTVTLHPFHASAPIVIVIACDMHGAFTHELGTLALGGSLPRPGVP